MSTDEEGMENSARARGDACPSRGGKYVFRLYVSGLTPNSRRAIANLNRLCDEHLHGCYELQVVDIYQQPEVPAGEQIIAAPTLVKELPLPVQRFIGDLSDTEKVLLALDIEKQGETSG